MKRLFTYVLASILCINISTSINAQDHEQLRDVPQKNRFVEGVLLIKLTDEYSNLQIQEGQHHFGIPSLDEKLNEFSVVSIEKAFEPLHKESYWGQQLNRIYKLTFNSGASLYKMIRSLNKDPNTEYVEAVPYGSYTYTPNDSLFDGCWYFEQIMAEEAWDIHKGEDGEEEVVIAVVDNGVLWMHDDLVNNLWQNLEEDADEDGHTIELDTNGNWILDPGDLTGTDPDDGGLYPDDLIGWNIYKYNNLDDGSNPMPEFFLGPTGHGTYCAGIVSGETDNLIGISSLSFNLKFMPVAIGPYDIDIHLNGYNGIKYAADKGADIISCSWGTLSNTISGQEVINYANEQGCIVVAAAGNKQLEYFDYPASHTGVISVANTTSDDTKYWSSSYNCAVDISSPGEGICTTGIQNEDEAIEDTLTNKYVSFSGTSASGPVVAAAMGLVKSYHPDWENYDIIHRVLTSTDNIDDLNPGLENKLGSGRLNAYQMLNGDTTESPFLKIGINNVIINDANGDGIMQAGETVNIDLNLRNFSHLYGVENATVNITCTDPDITITNGEVEVEIPRDSNVDVLDLELEIDPGADMHLVEFFVNVESDLDVFYCSDLTFKLYIEAGGYLVYDGINTENDFSGFFILEYLDNNGYDPVYLSGDDFPASLNGFEDVYLSFGNYESGSRTFTNDMMISVVNYLESGGDVYIEGADHFGFDQISNYALFEMFGLEEVVDADTEENNIDELNGLDGSIMEGLLYTDNTQDENAWIDLYTASEDGIEAFNEEGYGLVGVEYNAGEYQTFTFAYAIAHLIEGDTISSPEIALQNIIDFFAQDNDTSGTNINELSNNPFSIKVYPNPAQEWTRIQYTLSKTSDMHLEIYSAAGQLLLQKDMLNSTQGRHDYFWDLSEVPSGVYYYRLYSEEAISSGKISVVK